MASKSALAVIASILLAGASVRADDPPCPPATPPPVNGDELYRVQVAIEHLDWESTDIWSAANAHCRTARVEPQAMRAFVDGPFVQGSPLETRTIHGVRLDNQPRALLDLFDQLTTSRGGPSDQATLQVPDECHDFHCAADAVLGADIADRIEYIQARYGLNTSHLSGRNVTGRQNVDPLRPEELDDIAMAASNLPPALMAIERGHPVVHETRGHDSGTTVADAETTLFDNWTRESRHDRIFTVTHELGHTVGTDLELDHSPTFLALSGWQQRTQVLQDGYQNTIYVSTQPACLVSRYGATNPDEDFAESFRAYRYSPQLLKDRCPAKYQYMKELVFNGVEYTSEAACSNPALLTDQTSQAVSAQVDAMLAGSASARDTHVTAAVSSCREALMDSFVHNGPGATLAPTASGCLSSSLDAQIAAGPPPTGLDGITNTSEYLRLMPHLGATAPVSAARATALQRQAQAQMKTHLKAVFLRLFGRAHDYAFSSRRTMDLDHFCDDMTKYAYQEAQQVGAPFAAPHDTQADLFFYEQSGTYQQWLSRACHAAFSNGHRSSRSARQAEAAVNSLFGGAP
ncbi:MAG TPA: hypothetical protein VL588_09555 [Bdellovibrionota bacterium]|jgi:hypothetical protein|nr:hypothetical protein [Bdellovibrionota bacterium]